MFLHLYKLILDVLNFVHVIALFMSSHIILP